MKMLNKICTICGNAYQVTRYCGKSKFCSKECKNKPREIPDLTQEYLKSILTYDPVTGIFTWAIKKAIRFHIGQIAGNFNQDGYRVIMIDGFQYFAHRLAWLYIYGEWPSDELDHINNIRDDNAINNLREANRSQNMRNARTKKTSTSGMKGALKGNCKKRPWISKIRINGKNIFLGNFKTANEAHAAYCDAAKKEYGDFFNVGHD